MMGILLIDKAPGWTSHDVVAKLRGLLRERKIGHAGTLDPMATGLLTVFVGKATRAVSFAEAANKTYIARVQFGTETDTQDSTGRVIATSDIGITREDVIASLPQFRGELTQVPPMYSAVQVNGERLYKLARRGVEVERNARPITIFCLELLPDSENLAAREFELEITCSKGTYIRTLCHDMGQSFGCGGMMTALRRTHVGAFSVDDAMTIAELTSMPEAASRAKCLRPLDSLFAEHPILTLTPAEEHKFRNGQAVCMEAAVPERYRVYSQGGEFLAFAEIAVRQGKAILVSKKNFFMNA